MLLVSILAAPALAAAGVYVPAGGDLQAAINRASPGDQILLQPGATFVGPLTLPNKGRAGGLEIVIRTATIDEQLPPARRVGPADAWKMARLVSTGDAPVVRTAPAARGYRLIGLEIAPAPGVALINVVLLGSWTAGGLWTERRSVRGDESSNTRINSLRLITALRTSPREESQRAFFQTNPMYVNIAAAAAPQVRGICNAREGVLPIKQQTVANRRTSCWRTVCPAAACVFIIRCRPYGAGGRHSHG